MASVYDRPEARTELQKAIWKQIAFLGRYGNQPMDVCLAAPRARLNVLADAVNELMSEEQGKQPFFTANNNG